MNGPAPQRISGYALLDVPLALTIFAVYVTGLVLLLQKTADTSAAYARDRLIQHALDGLVAETKRKPVRDMSGEFTDEALDVTFRTEVTPLDLSNADGDTLKDLYQLTVTAEFEDEGGLQQEVAQVYIYQPERR